MCTCMCAFAQTCKPKHECSYSMFYVFPDTIDVDCHIQSTHFVKDPSPLRMCSTNTWKSVGLEVLH